MIVNKNQLEITRTQIIKALFQFDVKPGYMAEIEALLTIPTSPFWVLPLVCDILSLGALSPLYGHCADQMSASLSLTDKQRLYLLVHPKVREYIGGINPIDSDVHYADEIDHLIGFNTVQEKIAAQHAIGLKGGLYNALAAGSSMYDYPHFHESFLHMPIIAMKTLSKAIEELYSQDSAAKLMKIQKNKPSILQEARIKLVLSLFECGANTIELIPHVAWLERFHPHNKRWKTVKQHHYLISQMTDTNVNTNTF